MTKKRKTALVLAIVGVMAVAAALAGIIPGILNTQSPPAGSVGIIGGADGPSATRLTGLLMFSSPFCYLLLAGIGCLIAAPFLAFSKRK